VSSKKQLYQQLVSQAQAIMAGEKNLIANMSNLSAIIFNGLSDVNWAGFYLYDANELVLGPFQGQPACIRIPIGKGVCGTAAATGEVQLIEDVHQFDGHIACDAASNSEVVVPFYHGDELVGVLDIDSPKLARFDEQDKQGMEDLVAVLCEACFS
jgi:GAF domain-containing protein